MPCATVIVWLLSVKYHSVYVHTLGAFLHYLIFVFFVFVLCASYQVRPLRERLLALHVGRAHPQPLLEQQDLVRFRKTARKKTPVLFTCARHTYCSAGYAISVVGCY